jgi:hypothetical protein
MSWPMLTVRHCPHPAAPFALLSHIALRNFTITSLSETRAKNQQTGWQQTRERDASIARKEGCPARTVTPLLPTSAFDTGTSEQQLTRTSCEETRKRKQQQEWTVFATETWPFSGTLELQTSGSCTTSSAPVTSFERAGHQENITIGFSQEKHTLEREHPRDSETHVRQHCSP